MSSVKHYAGHCIYNSNNNPLNNILGIYYVPGTCSLNKYIRQSEEAGTKIVLIVEGQVNSR